MGPKLGLTVDPDRIPHGPMARHRILSFIGRCQTGCLSVAVDDKTLPQAPQIRFTDAYEQGNLDIDATVIFQRHSHTCSRFGRYLLFEPDQRASRVG